MIGELSHDHLRQQACSGRALFDRLRRFVRRLHRAIAGVLQAHVLNHAQGRRNVVVALAGLFGDQTQILAASGAVLVGLGQIVHDSLALQMPRQRLASAALLRRHLIRTPAGLRIVVGIVLVVLGRLLFGLVRPARPPRTKPTVLSTAARFCGCAVRRVTRATGFRTCAVRRRLGPVDSPDRPPSSATCRHPAAGCWDRWALCIQSNRQAASIPSKNRIVLEMSLHSRTAVTFLPLCRAQIDAAQQCSEFLYRNLKPPRAGLARWNGVSALLRAAWPRWRIRRGPSTGSSAGPCAG